MEHKIDLFSYLTRKKMNLTDVWKTSLLGLYKNNQKNNPKNNPKNKHIEVEEDVE